MILMKTKAYGIIKEMRITHWIKNGIIFIPIFFGGKLEDISAIIWVCIGFILFSLISSIIYILNDLQDIEMDKLHPNKKNRPIASELLTKKEAIIIIVILSALSIALLIFIWSFSLMGVFIIAGYISINLWYSVWGGKAISFVEIGIVVMGYVLRLFLGGILGNVDISVYLFLTIIAVSLFLVLGKRWKEKEAQINARDVLRKYSSAFLEKGTLMSMTLALVYCSIWTIERGRQFGLILMPIILFISYRYLYDLEKEDIDGDPIAIIFHDWVMILSIFVFGVVAGVLIYLN